MISADRPFVHANVVLLAVTDGRGGFLLTRHPEDHKFASARGKLDLPNTEHPDDQSPEEAAITLANKRLGSLNTHTARIIGTARNVDYYPDRREYRDTRRVFMGLTCPDITDITSPTGEVYTVHQLADLKAMKGQFRRDFFLTLLEHQGERAAEEFPKVSKVSWYLWDQQDQAIAKYVNRNPWPPVEMYGTK